MHSVPYDQYRNSKLPSLFTDAILRHTNIPFSFVVVWDRKGAQRVNPVKCDLIPPHYTFAGEIIDKRVFATAPTGQPKVRGNAFSCVAESPDEVRAKMLSSVYCQEVRISEFRRPERQFELINLYRDSGIWILRRFQR